MTADLAASPAAIVLRTGILVAMALAIMTGFWPIAAATLAGLLVDQALALIRRRPALAWALTGPLATLDRSRFGRHWIAVVNSGPGVGTEAGFRDALRRLYRTAIAVSATLAQWSPFVLFGITGPALRTTWLLDGLLIAAYPLLGISHYAERRRQMERRGRSL